MILGCPLNLLLKHNQRYHSMKTSGVCLYFTVRFLFSRPRGKRNIRIILQNRMGYKVRRRDGSRPQLFRGRRREKRKDSGRGSTYFGPRIKFLPWHGPESYPLKRPMLDYILDSKSPWFLRSYTFPYWYFLLMVITKIAMLPTITTRTTTMKKLASCQIN